MTSYVAHVYVRVLNGACEGNSAPFLSLPGLPLVLASNFQLANFISRPLDHAVHALKGTKRRTGALATHFTVWVGHTQPLNHSNYAKNTPTSKRFEKNLQKVFEAFCMIQFLRNIALILFCEHFGSLCVFVFIFVLRAVALPNTVYMYVS